LEDGVRNEHCVLEGYNQVFVTTNYGIKTTPEQEYKIAIGDITCPEDHMKDKNGATVRIVQKIGQLKEIPFVNSAGLREVEILAVVLYTGPMFQVSWQCHFVLAKCRRDDTASI